MRRLLSLISIGVLVASVIAAWPARAQLSNGLAANGVLGPSDLTTRPAAATTASRFNGPNGVVIDPVSGKLFVADRANNRVLRWSSADKMTNGSSAEAVLGQPDFVTASSAVSAVKMNNPIGLYLDPAGRLWVGDYGNNRVLRFDDAANKASGAAADGVLGQPDFVTNSSATSQVKMNGPVGLWMDAAGRLYVSQFANHRVLRFDDAANKPNGAAADGVLGQTDFTTATSGLSATKMNNPNSVYVDAAGRLWVSDYTNRRVLRFDDAANKANGAAADGVLGQPDFATNSAGVTQSKFSTTRYVHGDAAGRLYVVEEANNRLMIFNDAASLANGASADYVIGQAGFTTNTGPNPPTATSLATPRSVWVDYPNGRLWLADWANNRVLRYDVVVDTARVLALTAPVGGEQWTVGSTRTITWSSTNVANVSLEYSVDGGATWTTITTSTNGWAHAYGWTVPAAATRDARIRIRSVDSPILESTGANFAIYDGSPILLTSSMPAVGVLGTSDLTTKPAAATTASRFNGPNGVVMDPVTGKLFIADRGNNRVLRWSSVDAMTNGSSAEAVLGQPDFVTATGAVSAVKLNNPIGLYLDPAGRLWVGDYGNNRVVRYDDAIHKANGAAADGVLGQPDFVTNSSATSQVKMNGPVGLWMDGSGRLYVSQFANHRVLRFDDAANKPNGAAADGVLGQTDFTTATSGLSATKMNNPNSVYVDAAGRLWVSDYTNRRVLRFDDAANKANGAAADGVLGQPDFATNSAGVTQSKFSTTRYVHGDAAGRLYVVEEANNRLMIFNDAASLANGASADYVIGQPNFTTNTALNPPTATSLTTPRSLVLDELIGRIWLADWANNRVLRYDLAHAGATTLVLVSPNGGESWVAGTSHAITWSSTNVANVNLEYSVDGGSAWTTIASGVTAAAQTYAWTVPFAATSQALVRVTDASNASLTDVSGSAFSITLPVSTLSLLSPNGLQQWEAGAVRNILFTSANVTNVKVEVSADNGGSWSVVAASAPAGSGVYAWTVPATLGTGYRVRVTNVDNAAITATSAQSFAVVPAKTNTEFDYVYFSDSPTATYYDASYMQVTAPSTLERVNSDKAPVSTAYSLVGNYSLKLNWTSAAGGDWAAANASNGWIGHDCSAKDSLIFNVFTETATTALPSIFLEDLSNVRSPRIPLSTFVSSIPAGSWQRIAIPMQAFRDNHGSTDLTRIKTIFLGQQDADAVAHVWYMDDFRMIGGKPVTGDSTKIIVVLGSSTSAGTGASVPDSAWVSRYRAYVNAIDPTAKVVNLAVGGYTTYHVMPTGFVPPSGRPNPVPSANITLGLAYKPWAIIVNLPSNDAASNYTVAEQLANYDTLRSRAAAAGVPIWITSAQPRNFTDANQRDQLRIATDSILVRYAPYAIDLYHGLSAADGTILPLYSFGDGIHLNNAGHRYVYEQVVGADVWNRMFPAITVTSPNGGEELVIGTTATLSWTAAHLAHVSSFDLALSRNGAAGPWTSLGSTTTTQLSLPWSVAGPLAYQTCLLRVTAHGPLGDLSSDVSDAAFSVIDPAVPTLLSLFAAEPVAGGVSIRWQFDAGSGLASVELQRGASAAGPWESVDAERVSESGATLVVDRDAPAGTVSYYRLVGTMTDGRTLTFGSVNATAQAAVTEFALGRVFPNPARGAASLEFAVPVRAHVEVAVLDVQGRVVSQVANGTYDAGRYTIAWNGRTPSGPAAAGLYFVRMNAPGHTFTRRLVFVR